MEKEFKAFEGRWELVNKRPVYKADVLLSIAQVVLVGGAALLAGSRTSAVIVKLGVLSHLGSSIFGGDIRVWEAIETILGFATIETSIFLAGYLSGENKNSARGLMKALLGLGLLTSLSTNLYPGLELLIPDNAQALDGAVNLIIGLAAPLMLFISGQVMSSVRSEKLWVYSQQVLEWEQRKKSAWLRSKEYRSTNTPVKRKTRQRLSKPEAELIEAISSGSNSVEKLVRSLKLTEEQVYDLVFPLEKKKVIKIENKILNLV